MSEYMEHKVTSSFGPDASPTWETRFFQNAHMQI